MNKVPSKIGGIVVQNNQNNNTGIQNSGASAVPFPNSVVMTGGKRNIIGAS